jgi:predicted alpha/beta superfamily hydrolase
MQLSLLILAGVVGACAAFGAARAQPDTASPGASSPLPYTLADTEVRGIHSRILQRDYQVFVGLPDGYGGGSRRYPVLFVADANYAFPLLRSIARRVGDGGRRLGDFILVGLSYAHGDTATQSRNRDYTPTPRGPGEAAAKPTGAPSAYGQAELYRRFLADEVFPVIAKNYRADMARKTFAGHSYGSLLGTHILLTEPAMFERYILSSPSLWFDDECMMHRLRTYVATHKDLPAKVYMLVGGRETGEPAEHPQETRHKRKADMVAEVSEFARLLRASKYPSLSLKTEVIANEDHLTVNPISYTRGLLWAMAPNAVP